MPLLRPLPSLLLASVVLWASACTTQQPPSPGALRLKVEEGAWEGAAVVDFGRVTQAGPATRALHLTNAGGTALEVAGLLARGGEAVSHPGAPDEAAPFSLGLTLPLQLAPGETRTVEARFHPERGSGAWQRAEVALQVAGGGEAQLVLGALADVRPGVPAGLLLEPEPVDCGAVPPGGEARVPVQLRSQLAAPLEHLTFTSSHPEELTLLDEEGEEVHEASLSAGGTLSLVVRCRPLTALWYGRVLEVVAGAPLSTSFRIPVSRLSPSSGPVAELSPVDVLELGEVAVLGGQPARSSEVVVRNAAWAEAGYEASVQLRLGQQQADGTRRAPYVEVVPLSGTQEGEVTVALASSYSDAWGLRMGETAAFTVTAAPRTEGVKQVDLRFFSNDPVHPVKVLRVTARAVALPDCQLAVEPEVVDFGEVGATASTATVTLRNTGEARCLLTNLALTPDSHAAFSVVRGGREAVALGAGQAHEVALRAEAAGPAQPETRGTLRFGVSSLAEPVRDVPVRAHLLERDCLVVAPLERDFGTAQVGCSSQLQTFRVYNACSREMLLLGFTVLDGAGTPEAPEFAIVQQPQIPHGGLLLEPGALGVEFLMRYRPVDTTSDLGSIAVNALVDGQPFSKVVTVRGRGDEAPVQTDVFALDARPRRDVLVVLDTSPSMADDMARLQPTFEDLADTYAAHCLDVRVGVTTADLSSGGAQGRLLGDEANPPVLDSLATPGFREKLLQKLAQPLTSTAPAQPLAASVRAFSEPLLSGANAGFRRADTPLRVLIVTDREDGSPGTVADSVEALASAAEEQPGHLSISSYSGREDAASCGASPAPRLLEASSLTSGVQESICRPDNSAVIDPCWSWSWGSTFHLTSYKDAASPIEVFIDGVPVPESTESGEVVWRYDATTHSVTFSPAYAPQPGSTLRITYRTRCSEG